ncbi:MAG: hypothetical protein KDD82_12925, partial [Planctomycetes bacterium]|nr:hypothetical protein [Planctomycetota bacterium]
MTRSQLTLCSLLLVGCSSAPEDGVGGASSNRQPWTPPPPVLAVLERALDELPRFLELDPGTVRVSASATVPLEIAYPSLRTERLEA